LGEKDALRISHYYYAPSDDFVLAFVRTCFAFRLVSSETHLSAKRSFCLIDTADLIACVQWKPVNIAAEIYREIEALTNLSPEIERHLRNTDLKGAILA
jgi:hypothetical protein